MNDVEERFEQCDVCGEMNPLGSPCDNVKQHRKIERVTTSFLDSISSSNPKRKRTGTDSTSTTKMESQKQMVESDIKKKPLGSPETYKSGTLWKRSEFLKKWRKINAFVDVTSQVLLYHYEKEGSKEVSVDLHSMSLYHNVALGGKKHPECFSLQGLTWKDENDYVFRARDEAEKIEWVNIIRKAMSCPKLMASPEA